MDITASIIQGSSIGPAAYVINTGDLQAVTPDSVYVCRRHIPDHTRFKLNFKTSRNQQHPDMGNGK